MREASLNRGLGNPARFPSARAREAEELLEWAFSCFGSDQVSVTSSMQDLVLVDLVLKVNPAAEIVFLDTRFHFMSTTSFLTEVERRYGIDVLRLRPAIGAPDWHRDGYEACCAARKVEPLRRHLAVRQAWITGIRRNETVTRVAARPVEIDDRFHVVKVNPLVNWSDEDVASYIDGRSLPTNPLLQFGFGSIGCQPCTVPGAGREGRWGGARRLECGLHSNAQAPADEGMRVPADGVSPIRWSGKHVFRW